MKYYFTCPTTATNRADDPVQVFIKKLGGKNHKIFFGKDKAVVEVELDKDPDVSTETHVEKLVAEDLKNISEKTITDYGFNAEQFLKVNHTIDIEDK